MGQTWQHTPLDQHLEGRVAVLVTLRPRLRQQKMLPVTYRNEETSIKSIGA